MLIVDTQSSKVTGKIKVGNHPHSVVLDKNGKNAYVSNQWSDDVSVINLEARQIIDTLKQETDLQGSP